MSEITLALWVRLALYGVWLTASAGAIGVLDPDVDSAAIGIALLTATAALGVLRPVRASHLAFATLASLVYAGLLGVRASAPAADPDAPYLPAAVAGVVAFSGAAIAGDLIRGALRRFDDELRARQRVIEELETIDAVTGAVKRAHAQRLINEEVERSRRYQRRLSLVILGPDRWEEIVSARGQQAAQALRGEVAHGLIERVRAIDQVIHLDGPDFALLLPETDLAGAQIVAEKMVRFGTETYGQETRAGIASFPEDQVTGPGLWEEAEEALAFARTAQIGIASRALLT